MHIHLYSVAVFCTDYTCHHYNDKNLGESTAMQGHTWFTVYIASKDNYDKKYLRGKLLQWRKP